MAAGSGAVKNPPLRAMATIAGYGDDDGARGECRRDRHGLRLSHRRAPATGTSTVTGGVSKLAAARPTRVIERTQSRAIWD